MGSFPGRRGFRFKERDIRMDRQDRLRREREDEEGLILDIRELLLAGDGWTAANVGLTNGLSDEVPRLTYKLWQDKLIDLDTLSQILPEVWIHNKSPERSIGQEGWVHMFNATGFLWRRSDQITTNADGLTKRVTPAFAHLDICEAPSEPMVLWRGGITANAMAWTLYEKCAREFAEGVLTANEAWVYRATVPAEAVLAAFQDHQEQEIVVNPEM
jgi:hypothetical protein